MIFEAAKKSTNIWATFLKKYCQELLKYAQSGHTAGRASTR